MRGNAYKILGPQMIPADLYIIEDFGQDGRVLLPAESMNALILAASYRN